MFITQNYFNENLAYYGNIETKIFSISCKKGEDKVIEELLGEKLYNDLLSKIETQTLSNDEIDLVNKLKPVSLYATAIEALPMINYKITNKGIQVEKGDFTDSGDSKMFSLILQGFKSDMEYYKKRVFNFLNENASKYSLYKFGLSNDINPDNNSTYDMGILMYNDNDTKYPYYSGYNKWFI